MRDLGSCFSEYAVHVSDPSCSSYANASSCISLNLIPSIQNSVTCLYRTILSSQKQVLITVIWSKNNVNQGLNINFGDDPSKSFKLIMNSRLFRKKRGNKSFEFDDSKFEVFWDLSAAKYSSGPEPIDGYYVVVTVDSELGLILGSVAAGEASAAKKIRNGTQVAKFALVSRREHFSGDTHYSTRAQFSDAGASHDIVIRCAGENEGMKHPVLSVCIDKKTVIRVKRLQWNFRGNQTIFLDGLLVDLLWDLHGWFFGAGAGNAVFMFRTRSGLDSRLWLEEKVSHKDDEKLEFSLLIYASKSP